MKLSASLLQAIALGVSVTAVTAASTSCEKQNVRKKKEQATESRTNGSNNQPAMENCPACGMG